jgi:hypothetical protein
LPWVVVIERARQLILVVRQARTDRCGRWVDREAQRGYTMIRRKGVLFLTRVWAVLVLSMLVLGVAELLALGSAYLLGMLPLLLLPLCRAPFLLRRLSTEDTERGIRSPTSANLQPSPRVEINPRVPGELHIRIDPVGALGQLLMAACPVGLATFPLMNCEHDPSRVAQKRRSWEATMMRGSMIVSTGLLVSILCLHGSVRAQDGKKTKPEKADSAAAARQSARDALTKLEKPGLTWQNELECRVALARAGPEAVPVLLDALEAPSRRGIAIEALSFLFVDDGTVRQALEKFRPAWLKDALDKDRNTRLYAIHLLGRLGRIESKPKYLEIADKDPSEHVRFEMKYALTRDDKPDPGPIRRALSSYDLTRMDSAHLGKAAPDFEIADTTGKTWRLSKFRGKKSVVLVFLIFIN